MRLVTLLVTFCILATQTACAAVPPSMPPYVVLLTPSLPIGKGNCTGVVIAPKEVLTAAHCVESAKRVVTVYGQEVWVTGARISTTHDVAVLHTNAVMWTGEYAKLGNPAVGKTGYLWGYCPYYPHHVARRGYYNGLFSYEVGDMQADYGWWIMLPAYGDSNKGCGGDSGGIFEQEGKVVGVISALYSEYYFVALGSDIFTVPMEDTRALVTQGADSE